MVRNVENRSRGRRELSELGLTLPHLIENVRWVGLTAPQQAAYRRAATVWNYWSRAQQLNAACALADGRSAKAEAAVAWLRDRPNIDKAVVFAENLNHLTIAVRLLDEASIGGSGSMVGPRTGNAPTWSWPSVKTPTSG